MAWFGHVKLGVKIENTTAAPMCATSRKPTRAASSHGLNCRNIRIGSIMAVTTFMRRSATTNDLSVISVMTQRKKTSRDSNMVHNRLVIQMMKNAAFLSFKNTEEYSIALRGY